MSFELGFEKKENQYELAKAGKGSVFQAKKQVYKNKDGKIHRCHT